MVSGKQRPRSDIDWIYAGAFTLAEPTLHLGTPIVLAAGDDYFSNDASATPEPASFGLLPAGAGAIALRRKFARRA